MGCDALDSRRRPTTPFGVVTDNEPAAVARVGQNEQDAGPRAPVRLARGPSEDPYSWRVGGKTLEAPPGLAFQQAVTGPSADGVPAGATAWLAGAANNPILGELWHYPAEGPPRRLSVAPSFLPTGPTCSHSVRLESSGPRSLTLDITAQCGGPLLPRTAVRSLTVLSPGRSQPKLLSLRVAPAAVGERLEIALASQDPDRDGRDDVQLQATLHTSVGSAELRLAWLDRSAGLSRDMRWPARSFEKLAAKLRQSAAHVGKAVEVAQAVAAARRLYGSLCAAGGVPRVFNSVGDGLPCGPLGRQFEALSEAHISAALSAGDRLGALGALEQHGWFPSRGGADQFADRQARRILKGVPRRSVSHRQLVVRPALGGSPPQLSPLRYASDGSLLVLSAGGTTRVTQAGYEYEASPEPGPWPTRLTSPQGEQLTGIAFPCERSEVLLLRATSLGVPLEPVLTGLTAPRPGRCRDFAAWKPPPVTLLGWRGSTPSGYAGAAPLGSPALHGPWPWRAGAPVSVDGRLLAVSTRWGILLLRGRQAELWSPTPPRRFNHCVPRHDGQALACLGDGKVHILTKDGAPAGG